MRRVKGLLAMGCLVALVSAAPAAPMTGLERLIRVDGIGKVRLGMSLPQVKKALGSPRIVLRTLRLRSGGRYVEYQWEVEGDLAPDTWTVGLRSATRRGALRVVRVSTTVRSERTREGLGVGSLPRQIVKAFPNATCVVRDYTTPYKGEWVVVEHGNRAMTAFLLYSTQSYGKPENPHKVIEVLVQPSWFTPSPGRCLPGWQRW